MRIKVQLTAAWRFTAGLWVVLIAYFAVITLLPLVDPGWYRFNGASSIIFIFMVLPAVGAICAIICAALHIDALRTGKESIGAFLGGIFSALIQCTVFGYVPYLTICCMA